MIIVNPKTALISLSDKTNLEEIVSFLIKKDQVSPHRYFYLLKISFILILQY